MTTRWSTWRSHRGIGPLARLRALARLVLVPVGSLSEQLAGVRGPVLSLGVRQAEQMMAAADANVTAARAAFLPTIQLTGQYGYQSALLSTLLRPELMIFSIAANVTQPIFDGGRLRGELQLNEAQRLQMLETYRKALLSGLIDVENALIAIRENTAREIAQRRAVTFARQAFTLGEQRLNQGTIDITTLLTTQVALFQAEDALIQARLARFQAVVSLYQALGGDWEDGHGPPIGLPVGE